MKVTEIMSRPVITVTPRTTIKEAAELLVMHGISALPVLDQRGRLVGIVSEADLMPIGTRIDPRKQAIPPLPTAGSTPRLVSDVMTRRLVTVPMDAEASQAARIMIEAEVKRVPVVSGRRVVGIVSRRDLVRLIARRDEDVKDEISRLLVEAGISVSRDAVDVVSGVAIIRVPDRGPARRLAESIALAVPGVLEVRFTT